MFVLRTIRKDKSELNVLIGDIYEFHPRGKSLFCDRLEDDDMFNSNKDYIGVVTDSEDNEYWINAKNDNYIMLGNGRTFKRLS